MAKFTFTFLIVTDEFQDSVSYEIEGQAQFEEVISHLCTSFNFDRSRIELKSSLGFPIASTQVAVNDIVQQYGLYFKLMPVKTDTAAPNVNFTEFAAPQQIQQTPTEEFNDVMDDLMEIRAQSWEVDLEGLVEITIIPQTQSLISQVKVKFDARSQATLFFSYVSKILEEQETDVIVAVVGENVTVIEDLNLPLVDIINKHGSVFFIYPLSMKEEVENKSVLEGERMRDLIFKYKSHNRRY
ncbi:MAG: hypothetical protein ACXAE3_00880 [Candidatus Kariarchaeaceae archaeon]